MKTDDTLHPLEKIHELMQTAHAADVCFEIWRLLTFKNTTVDTDSHVRAFGAYRQFFIPSVHAHLIALVMALFRLFDPDSGVSLPSCNDLRQKLSAPQNKLFRRKLDSVRNVAERVAGLRNHLFGHRGDIAAQAAFDEAKLKRDELRHLIDTARELVEMLRSAWDFPKEAWPPNNAIADTVRLLDRLGQ